MRGIRRPAPRPRRWAYDVIRASYRLSAELKHAWKIIVEFDSTAGCWASPVLLAKLCGIPSDLFAKHIGCLRALGLVTVVEQGEMQILFASLPASLGFPGDETLEREDKLLCAERLDQYVAERVRLGLQIIGGNELQENERDCSTASSSPAVTAVPSGGTPPRESPTNGNGKHPGAVTEPQEVVVGRRLRLAT